MAMKLDKLEQIKNEPVPYIDHYVLDGVEFGRGLFNLEWVAAATETPKVIFDVGCYDCGDSIRFKQRFPSCEVYSFEASPKRHAKLHETAARYGLNFNPIAVSDKIGELTFYDSLVDNQRVDAQGSFFKHTDIYKQTNPRIIQQNEGTVVETTSIKDFCVSKNITEIDLLYVDVEGAEFQVITGMRDLRPKMVFVETLDLRNSQPMWKDGATNSRELENYLFSIGYKLGKILDDDRLYYHESVLE